ncbi:MAG: PqqD family protein [Vicinamibacterales bacterium]
MSFLTHRRIPRAIPLCRLERIGDEVLLYHPGLTKAVYLNGTASLIWQLCDGQRSDEDIVVLLREGFPDEGADIAGDVHATLQRFSDEGAIEFI